MSDEVKVGDCIRHISVPGRLSAEVLEVRPCYAGTHIVYHDQYLIEDSATGDSDWVCSREFIKI